MPARLAALWRFSLILGAALAATGAASASSGHGAREQLFDERAALSYSQAAIGRSVGDHRFTGADGSRVALSDHRGRPVVVSLIYTSCAHACPLTTQSLRRAVEAAQRALGAEAFSVMTIGFDSRNDTPPRMRAYGSSQGIDLANWSFVSADAATVERIAADLGFLFVATTAGFDHLSQTTVLDAEGRVYAQVYGTDFAPPALVEPLKDLIFGRRANLVSVDGLLNRIRLVCTVYDPASGRYRFSYAVFVGYAIGFASLAAVLIFLVRAWREMRRA